MAQSALIAVDSDEIRKLKMMKYKKWKQMIYVLIEVMLNGELKSYEFW